MIVFAIFHNSYHALKVTNKPIDKSNYDEGIFLIDQENYEGKKYINFEKKNFIPHKRNGTKRIIILGDSVTDGMGSSNKIENSWPAEFYKLI